MTTTPSPVETEINEHKEKVNGYIESAKALSVPNSVKGVVDRYLQDCDTFVAYLDKQSTPSASDLCDFQDRCHSLEIQYNKLAEDYQ